MIKPGGDNESSLGVRTRVCASRAAQELRQGCANGQIPPDRLAAICQLGGQEQKYLETAALRLALSGRALHRTLRVARTIADIDGHATVHSEHIGEALAYRGADLPP